MTAQRTAHLSNPGADRVRRVRRLAERSGRSKAGMFLAEGPGSVAAAVATGQVAELYSSEPDRDAALIDHVIATGGKPFSCDPAVMAAFSDTVTPQGVLAVCPIVISTLSEAFESVGHRLAVDESTPATAAQIHEAAVPQPGRATQQPADRNQCPGADVVRQGFIVVLDQVQDPGNVGTVIRAADATGAAAVVLTVGCADPHNPKAVRSSAGSIFHLPITTGANIHEVLAAAAERQVHTLATSGYAATTTTELLQAATSKTGPLSGPHAWVFGNEAAGLADATLAEADTPVAVPILGQAESLNVAMAATACCYTSVAANQLAIPGQQTCRAGSAAGELG